MDDYISRDMAIARLTKVEVTENLATMTDAKRVIADMPAADVAPVVHCKDCRYWQDNNGGYPNEECRWRENETPDADDFCSYGKRKDGDDNAAD